MDVISDFENWEYRAEGNLHIIVANQGTKEVLRLLKCCKDRAIYEDRSPNDAADNELSFVHHVAHPLMRNCKACFPVHRTPLSRDFLKNISKKVEPYRPTFRLHKIIDQRCKYGILMPDFCQVLPPPTPSIDVTISVEIKPKQGFILMGQNRCNFSQFQRMKVQSEFYENESTYCPLDLFSGCRKRMQRAIKALIHHPQNNLRVFKNGNMIYSQEILKERKCERAMDMFKGSVLTNFASHVGDSFESKERLKRASQNFQDLLCNLLLHPVCEQESDASHVAQYCDDNFTGDDVILVKPPAQTSNGKTGLKSSLPSNCVLGLLLSLQKLENRSITEYHDMYKSLKEHLDSFPNDSETLSLEGPYNATHWQKIVTEVRKTDMKSTKGDQNFRMSDMYEKASLLRKFLIATSFKDCSIIMTFQIKLHDDPIRSNKDCPMVIKTRNGQEYWCSLALVDSDPKPASRIRQYYLDACK